MDINELYRIFLNSPGICTDSRKTIPGSLFFALKGENFDGNKFAGESINKGCAYAIVDDGSIPDNQKFIRVNDVLHCLQELANQHRKTLKIPVIAVTGSNGKTTTKELCHAILSKKFNVHATTGNLNNHIGVPVTILSIKNKDLAIIEMGANHIGEIKTLCNIAEPDFGIVTNIGLAHLEGFGSAEGVKKGKAELFDFLKTNHGKAFYNANCQVISDLIRQKELDSIPYGNHPESYCNGEIIKSDHFLSARLNFGKSGIYIQTNLVGSYNLENIMAAAAMGNYFGVNYDDIKKAVENYHPSNNRSQYMTTARNKLILDAYNANPDSMRSSVLNFLSISDPFKKSMILGDMLELGAFADEQHEQIISLLEEKGFYDVYLVGPLFQKAARNSPFKRFNTIEELKEYFKIHGLNDRLILLKGSRGMRIEKIIDVL